MDNKSGEGADNGKGRTMEASKETKFVPPAFVFGILSGTAGALSRGEAAWHSATSETGTRPVAGGDGISGVSLYLTNARHGSYGTTATEGQRRIQEAGALVFGSRKELRAVGAPSNGPAPGTSVRSDNNFARGGEA
ncbi:hypothetical protein TraAM80_07453 [Trypanosoma rangeli]|uniref:Uncharacterized protein n=1 Tax=Trypanosoma rangeli TaxID=5698 RepID=A0A3R7K6F0_TRYRA|nr:uncharacterized protein TraAM80_07453 [Trypanosoma rangeli]RNF00728.1 hypothetical protein TraAM80_07453 [Trypanosoma rangeli]|eukprot:RNF00728.1 hypothetical protein TraAM80_07453 [Trypanosoma rangeli]